MSRKSFTEFLWFGWSGSLTVSVGIFLALCGVMRYVAGFGMRQSAALAFCFTLCAKATFGRPKAQPFKPFVTSFRPNFFEMLGALGLVSDKEDWLAQMERRDLSRLHCGEDPESYGFSCTTLSLANEFEDQVIAWQPWHKYSTEYRVSFPILAVNYTAMEGKHPEFFWNHPDFFVDWIDKDQKMRSVGFGVEVRKDWWKSRTVPADLDQKLLAIKDKSGNGIYPDYIRLFFGVLPIYELTRGHRDLFPPFLRPRCWDITYEKDQKRLAETGWDFKTDVFRHKYMSVSTYGTEEYLR